MLVPLTENKISTATCIGIPQNYLCRKFKTNTYILYVTKSATKNRKYPRQQPECG